MAKQIITVLCEGPHDVAFICRILKSVGFKSNENTKLGDYPPPMNAILQNEVVKTNVQDLNLTEVRRTILPSNVLIQGDNIIFLYSLEGDGSKITRQRILKELRQLIPEIGEIERLPKDTKLAVIYFFDADDKGIAQRVADINNEIKEALPETHDDLFNNHAEIKTVLGLKLGCFVFTEEGKYTGKLEHILLPLMKNGNEAIFNQAEIYLKNHFDDARLFPLKLSVNDNEVTEKRSVKTGDKKKYDGYKSIIGTVGQLQRSGKSNVVCISDTDFITLDKVLNNEKCQEIITFFDTFISMPHV